MRQLRNPELKHTLHGVAPGFTVPQPPPTPGPTGAHGLHEVSVPATQRSDVSQPLVPMTPAQLPSRVVQNSPSQTILGGHDAPVHVPHSPGTTMLGGHAAPQAPPPPPRKLGGTRMGHADPGAGTPSASPQAPLHPNAANASVDQTLLGLAAPLTRTTPEATPAVQSAGAAPWRPAPPIAPPPRQPPPSSTPATRGRTPADRRRYEQPPGFGSAREDGELAAAGVPRRSAKGGWLLLALAAVLFVGVIAFMVFWTPPRPLEAEVQVDARGQDVLVLRCEDCADGTELEVRGLSATVANQSATLSLPGTLEVGPNELEVSLERPGLGRDERVLLQVPVRYRMKADLSRLNDTRPALLVHVHVEPGASCVIDGHAVELRDGRGEHRIEVVQDVVGQSAQPDSLQREVRYSVSFADGSLERGQLSVRATIVPLVIEAPGTSAITDSEHFMLAGRTAPGGSVTVAGKPITVDPEGRFAQLMSVDSVGETNIFVRAQLLDHAPRLVRLKVQRVESMTQVAEAFRQSAVADYGAVMASLGERAEFAVALAGRVQESRISGHTTVLVLDVTDGCRDAPCLAKVVLGARKKLRPDARVTAFGHVVRAVAGMHESKKIPEIRADFLLP